MPPFQANSYSFLQDHNRCAKGKVRIALSFFIINIEQITV